MVSRELAAEKTKNTAMQNATKAFHAAITSKKDANGNPIDPIAAAIQLVGDKNDAEAAYRNERQIGGLGVGTTYGYFVDPKTGKQWQRAFPDADSVSRIQQWASDNNRQFETLSNSEINQALGVQDKTLGPPPQASGQQPAKTVQGQVQKSSTQGMPPPPTSSDSQQQPAAPKTLAQLRAEKNMKGARHEVEQDTGIEALGDIYKGAGKAISTAYGLDRSVIGFVGKELDTFLHGDPDEANEYEINGSQVKVAAKEAKDFQDHGYTVREKYNVNGHDVFMTPDEASKARQAGYKVASLRKHHGKA